MSCGLVYQASWPVSLQVSAAPPGNAMLLLVAFTSVPTTAFGGTVHAVPAAVQFVLLADAGGGLLIETGWPAGVPPGTQLWFQALAQDAGAVHGVALSNALLATAP